MSSRNIADSHSRNCFFESVGNRHPSQNLGPDQLGPLGYASEYQGFRCGVDEAYFQGYQGNDLLPNAQAEKGKYHDRQFDREHAHCHRLGAQMHKYRFGSGPGDWRWVVNTHLSLNPAKAATAFDWILDRLKNEHKLSNGDWGTLPVLVVGDFNVVYDGHDPRERAGVEWEETICSQEKQLDVSQTDHLGIEVVVRHARVDQVWSLSQ